jgi:hypothetical protein
MFVQYHVIFVQYHFVFWLFHVLLAAGTLFRGRKIVVEQGNAIVEAIRTQGIERARMMSLYLKDKIAHN